MPSAQSIRAGAAYVELYTKDSRLVRGLASASKRLKAFGSSVQALGTKMLAISGLILGPLGLTVKAASNMEETMNKFNVVFGDSSKEIKKWGDGLAAQIGRSKQQIASFMAGTQDLLIPIGFDKNSSTGLSKQLTQLAIDLASFNNMADADVLRDLHAALTGSGEVMKKYGVIVSEAAVKQELLNQGIDPKKATIQQKVMARLNIILKGTTAAQGDATRSAGSFANQMKALRARINDTAVEIGSALLPVVTPLVSWVAKAVSVVGEWIKQNQQLVVAILKISAALLLTGIGLIILGGLITGFGSTLGFLVALIGGVGSAIVLLGKMVAMLLTPLGMVSLAVVSLAGYILYATEVGGKAIAWLGEKFNVLKTDALAAWKGIGDALASGDIGLASRILWLSLKLEWKRGIHFLNGLWIKFKDFFMSVATSAVFGVARILNDGWAAIELAWSETVGFLADAWSVFTNLLTRTWHSTVGFIKKAWVRLKAVFKKDVDVDAEVSKINRQTRMANESADKRMTEAIGQREVERNQRRKQIESDRQSTETNLKQMQSAEEQQRKDQFSRDLAGTESDLADAKKDWQAAIAEAMAKKPKKEKADGAPEKVEKLEKELSLTAEAVGQQQDKVEVKGTFNALAARGLGADSLAERTAKATEQIVVNTKDLVNQAKQGKLVFGK